MPQQITEQAILLCDKGAKPSQLKVTSQNFCTAQNKLIATEQDKEAESNIPSFGTCTATHSACVPSIIQWDKTAQKDTINGFKILTENSTCQCVKGGKISVKNMGHTENHEIE